MPLAIWVFCVVVVVSHLVEPLRGGGLGVVEGGGGGEGGAVHISDVFYCSVLQFCLYVTC